MDTIKKVLIPVSYFTLFASLLIGCNENRIKEDGEVIEISEYRSRFVYEEWGIGEYETLQEEAFTRQLFELFDEDGDNFLSEQEWNGSQIYFVGDDYPAFNEWDVNNDGRLEQNEFETVVQKTGVFDRWDANNDELLDSDELSQGVFDTFGPDDGVPENVD